VQWGFCLGISGYSTLQNRRQSKEFHSLVFYPAIHPIEKVVQLKTVHHKVSAMLYHVQNLKIRRCIVYLKF
jgi:hypothetical protein